jgi:hypothetical protein
MSLKKLALPLGFIAFIFIGVGDRFLPSPLSSISLNTRTSINQLLVGLSPKLKSQNPDDKMEKAVDGLPH